MGQNQYKNVCLIKPQTRVSRCLSCVNYLNALKRSAQILLLYSSKGIFPCEMFCVWIDIWIIYCSPSFDIHESFCLRYYMSCVFIDIYMYMYGHKFNYHFKGKAVDLRKALFCWRKAVSVCDGLLAVFELFHLLWIVFF